MELEKNHNKIGTKINLELLQDKSKLSRIILQSHQFKTDTQEITENLSYKTEAEKVWFWTSIVVLSLFLTMAVSIVWN